MADQKIVRNAADKKVGMTLKELETFLAHAKVLEIPEDTPVKVLCSMKLRLTIIETA